MLGAHLVSVNEFIGVEADSGHGSGGFFTVDNLIAFTVSGVHLASNQQGESVERVAGLKV